MIWNANMCIVVFVDVDWKMNNISMNEQSLI